MKFVASLIKLSRPAAVAFVVITSSQQAFGWVGAWRQASVLARVSASASSIGIGGLKIDLGPAPAIDEADLAYRSGRLTAKIDGRTVAVVVSPAELYEAVKVAKTSPQRSYQVSLDRVGEHEQLYRDPAIEDTAIGALMSVADLAFASLIDGTTPLPSRAPIHPYRRANQLLQRDPEYQALSSGYAVPPLSWPQIHLRVDLTDAKAGLVNLEFRPEVKFRDPRGYAVDPASPELGAVADRPYVALAEDVRRRPKAYRQAVPTLDRSANVAIALALVHDVCAPRGACESLILSAIPSQAQFEASARKQMKTYQGLVRTFMRRTEAKADPAALRELFRNWSKSRDLATIEDTDYAWARAFDSLSHASEQLLQVFGDDTKRKPSRKELVEITQQVAMAIKQFSTFDLGERRGDPLLEAAAALAYTLDGTLDAGTAALETALNAALASEPSEQIMVGRLGLAVAGLLRGDESDQSQLDEVKEYLTAARMRLFDSLLAKVSECERGAPCSDTEIRTYEGQALAAGLEKGLPGKDTALLFIEMSCLIAERKPETAADRLRYAQLHLGRVDDEHRSNAERYAARLETVAARN